MVNPIYGRPQASQYHFNEVGLKIGGGIGSLRKLDETVRYGNLTYDK
jgi:hypothetical protein